MKFRKKPVVIEAFQMTRERRESNAEWPDWLHYAWQLDPRKPGAFWCDHKHHDLLYIHTLEGTMRVNYGDWIIQGINGELDPCEPSIFEATYEPADEEAESVWRQQ